MTRTKTFTLYLAKEITAGFEDVLTQKALDRIRAGDATISHSDTLGESAYIYIFETDPKLPNWWSDARSVFSDIKVIKNKSSCAIIVFKHVGRFFITSFGYGWQYIDDAKIEPEFGLRVTINTLGDNKVKRVDSNHLGEAMKGVSQSAFQRDFQSFGIDEALDLVRKITGRADDGDFANALSGSTSLKITKEMNLPDLPSVAEEALDRFKSDRYKKTRFYVIDKVRPVLDRERLQALDEEAVRVIKEGRDNFELSMPGWSEDDVVYYGFYGPGLRGRYPDLLMSNYRDALGDKIDKLNVNSVVSKHGVLAEFNNDASSKKWWSIKKALIGSLALDGGLYAISEGEWYRVDQLFKNDVDALFESLVRRWEYEPEKIMKKVSADGKKTGFESELEYNRRCANAYGQVCLDQNDLIVPSVPFGRFEACDLLDIEGKRLIHVKKSSRQSSVLSHFFRQGSNSARLMRYYPDARNELIKKVKKFDDNEAATKLQNALGDLGDGWTVEFHIVDAPRADGRFTIPFFSRITIRDEARSLRSMGFEVCVKFIPT